MAGALKKWRDQKWVRIGTDGKIKGPCGTSKNKKKPDRCLPLAKARSLSKRQLAATARKKKKSKYLFVIVAVIATLTNRTTR